MAVQAGVNKMGNKTPSDATLSAAKALIALSQRARIDAAAQGWLEPVENHGIFVERRKAVAVALTAQQAAGMATVTRNSDARLRKRLRSAMKGKERAATRRRHHAARDVSRQMFEAIIAPRLVAESKVLAASRAPAPTIPKDGSVAKGPSVKGSTLS